MHVAVILYTSLWNQLTTRQWSACLRDTIELNQHDAYLPQKTECLSYVEVIFEEPGELLDVEVN
jgi:hypothetical protein